MKEIKQNIRLKRERELRGWSQRVLAERVGTDEPGVSRWENGHNKPNRHFQERLCELFGKDAIQLGFIDDPETEDVEMPSNITSTLAIQQYVDTGSHSSSAFEQETTAGVDLFTLGITALVMYQQQHQWDINELEQRVTQALDEKVPEMQAPQQLSRRSALSFIARMPVALYGFANISDQSSTSLVLEEAIPLYAAGIPACWRLYYEGEQAEIERVIPSYLSHLTKLVKAPSKLQKSAAGLLSQTYQLMALIAQGHENFGRAIEYCKQAALHGQLAEDTNLQAMALIRQQDTYSENKRLTQSFLTLKQAEQFVGQITPLLRGRIYARLSLAHAHQSQAELAQKYLDFAQETFPNNPENDITFLYNHTTHFVLYANKAFMCIKLGQIQEAWAAIKKAEEYVSGSTNPRRIDITRYQVQVAIALNDLEQGCSLFETMLGYTKQFGQELDMGNAHDVYQQLATRWPSEKRVHKLGEYLTL